MVKYKEVSSNRKAPKDKSNIKNQKEK